jgi:glucokinase
VGVTEVDLSVGIDVGATKIVLGVVDAGGQVLARAKLRSWQHPRLEDNLASLLDTLDQLMEPFDRERFHGIGVGLPGTVDPARGIVTYTPNLRWFDLPLGPMLQRRTGLRTHLVQDTAAAAWGEYLFGAGMGLDNVACVTVGSGVACGIVIGGRLYGGRHHTAGEIGHLRVADPALACACGGFGCLEAGGSGLGLMKIVQRNVAAGGASQAATDLANRDARAVFDAARRGEPLALASIEEMIANLALGLSAVATTLAPDALIVSGGLSRERELLVDPLIERVKAISYAATMAHVKVLPAALGAASPLIGAAALYRAEEYGGAGSI